ncbi:hypothetical protein [Streptomyces sp. NPDC059161]
MFLVEEDYALQGLNLERGFVAKLIESLRDPAYIRAWHEMAEKLR